MVPSGATYPKSCQVWIFNITLLESPYTQNLDFFGPGGQSEKNPKVGCQLVFFGFPTHTNQ